MYTNFSSEANKKAKLRALPGKKILISSKLSRFRHNKIFGWDEDIKSVTKYFNGPCRFALKTQDFDSLVFSKLTNSAINGIYVRYYEATLSFRVSVTPLGGKFPHLPDFFVT